MPTNALIRHLPKLALLVGTTGLGGAAYVWYAPKVVEDPRALPSPKAPVKPSVFSAVGFVCEGTEGFQRLASYTVKRGKPSKCGRTTYYQLAVGQNAELWATRTKGKKLPHLQPHFAGSSRLKVLVLREVRHHGLASASGVFVVSAPTKTPSGVVNDIEFVIDSPALLKDRLKHYPANATLQLTALPRERIHAYPTGADYLESRHDRVAYEPGTLIPSSLYTRTGAVVEHPKPEGIMASVIIDARPMINPLTRRPFTWIRVKALGGTVDVVAEARQISGEVRKGGILEGSFLLSGRLNPPRYVPPAPLADPQKQAKHPKQRGARKAH